MSCAALRLKQKRRRNEKNCGYENDVDISGN